MGRLYSVACGDNHKVGLGDSIPTFQFVWLNYYTHITTSCDPARVCLSMDDVTHVADVNSRVMEPDPVRDPSFLTE